MSELTLTKPKLSIKAQALAALAAIAGAVALPQVFHLLGRISGAGTLPGEMLLPMQLPILLVGLLAGPRAGAIAGLLGPLISFWLSGMPTAAMLPFMMIELCAYGLFTGLLRNTKLPTAVQVLAAQLAGRAVRAAAILVAVYGFSNTAVSVASIYQSVLTGSFGILLQLVVLPLICYRVERGTRHER